MISKDIKWDLILFFIWTCEIIIIIFVLTNFDSLEGNDMLGFSLIFVGIFSWIVCALITFRKEIFKEENLVSEGVDDE